MTATLSTSELAAAFCAFCAGGNRPYPEERQGVVAYVHSTTEGERLVCAASALRLLDERAGRAEMALAAYLAVDAARRCGYHERLGSTGVGCDTRMSESSAYRCLDCHTRFCAPCLRRHFTEDK